MGRENPICMSTLDAVGVQLQSQNTKSIVAEGNVLVLVLCFDRATRMLSVSDSGFAYVGRVNYNCCFLWMNATKTNVSY